MTSGTEIRKYVTLVESWKAVTEEQQQSLAVLTTILEGDRVLAENLLSTVKDKAVGWMKKATEVGKKALPAITNKLDQSLQKVSTEISPQAAEDLKTELEKQGGHDWKSNVGKVAAGVAVATALLANPAQARTIYIIEPGRPVPVHHHNNRGAQFMGALIGSAIGAALGAQQQQPGY